MATQLQLQLRRDEAYKRIDAATRKLGAKPGEALRHRDPAIEQILRIEAIADSLEQLAKGQGKASEAQPPVTVETVKEDELKTVETVEIVPAAAAPKAKAKK
jgi:hypothetical protein